MNTVLVVTKSPRNSMDGSAEMDVFRHFGSPTTITENPHVFLLRTEHTFKELVEEMKVQAVACHIAELGKSEVFSGQP